MIIYTENAILIPEEAESVIKSHVLALLHLFNARLLRVRNPAQAVYNVLLNIPKSTDEFCLLVNSKWFTLRERTPTRELNVIAKPSVPNFHTDVFPRSLIYALSRELF